MRKAIALLLAVPVCGPVARCGPVQNPAGGSSGQVQFNSSGSLAGVAGSVVDSTTGSAQLQPSSDAVGLAVMQTQNTGPTSDVFQIFSSKIPTPAAPSLSIASGGSIPVGNVVTVEITYTQAYPNSAGETTPSGMATSAATTNGNQSLQITAPVRQGAAAGWNIYAAQCASPGPCTGLTQQGSTQASFTGTVTLTSVTNTGVAAPGSNTALAKALSVDASGNLNGVWTSVTYGQPNTTLQAFVLGYGAGNTSTNVSHGPFYIEGTSGGTSCSNKTLCNSTLFPSNSVNGLWYLDSIAPSGEGTAGKSIMTNPLLHEGSLVYGHTPIGSLSIRTPTELQIGASGQCLVSNGTDPVWGWCGSASYTAGAIAAANDIVCASADMTVADCPASGSTGYMGIALGSSTTVTLVTSGTALVNTDAAASPGNEICRSASTAGDGHPSASACPAGQGIGTVISISVNGASATKPLVQLMRY